MQVMFSILLKNINNEVIEYPLINILENQTKIWLTLISNNSFINNELVIIMENLQGYCSIYNEIGQFLGNLELNETVRLKTPISLIEIISATYFSSGQI